MLAFSSFFFFVFKIRKEDIMTSVSGERKDIPLLYARLPEGKIIKEWLYRSLSFSFPVSERKEEKTFRYSFRREERREEDAQQGFSFSFLFFVFCWRKEEDIRPRNGERKASPFFSSFFFSFFFLNKKPSEGRGREEKQNNAKKNPVWCKRRDMEGYHCSWQIDCIMTNIENQP